MEVNNNLINKSSSVQSTDEKKNIQTPMQNILQNLGDAIANDGNLNERQFSIIESDVTVSSNLLQSGIQKLSLKNFNISENNINTLLKIFSHFSCSCDLGVFENIGYFIYKNIQNLKKIAENDCFNSGLKKSLNILENCMTEYLYAIFIGIYFNHFDEKFLCYKSVSSFFPDTKNMRLEIIKYINVYRNELDRSINSEKEINNNLSRKANKIVQERNQKCKLEFQLALDELDSALLIFEELLQLTPLELKQISNHSVSFFSEWDSCVNFDKEPPFLRIKEYYSFIYFLFKFSRKNGLYTEADSEIKFIEKIFFIMSERVLSVEEKEISNLFCEFIQIRDCFFQEQESIAKKAFKQAQAAHIGTLTPEDFFGPEALKGEGKVKSKEEFCVMLVHFLLRKALLIETYKQINNTIVRVYTEKLKPCADMKELIRLHIRFIELKEQNQQHANPVHLTQILNDEFRKFIESSGAKEVFSQMFIELFHDYLSHLEQFVKVCSENFNEALINEIEVFTSNPNELTLVSWYKLKNNVSYFGLQLTSFIKHSKVLNKKINEQINSFEYKNFNKEFFGTLLLKVDVLRNDIIELLFPFIDIFYAINSAIKYNDNNKFPTFDDTIVDFDEKDLPDLFNCDLLALMQKGEEFLQKRELSDNLKNKKSLKKPKNMKEKSKVIQSHLAHKIESNVKNSKGANSLQIKSCRLKDLMSFLVMRGWEPSSINGSHLKLKLENQSLIVPINKPHLKKGTYKGIINQSTSKQNEINFESK